MTGDVNEYERLADDATKQKRIADHSAAWTKLLPVGSVNGTAEAAIRAFCEEKRITLDALAALGTRVKIGRGGAIELAWADVSARGVTALKLRPLDPEKKRHHIEPSTWLNPIIVGNLRSHDWFIAEGETEAARIYDLVGHADGAILILPTGALRFEPEWAEQIPRGATVYLGHDADDAGDRGAEKAARIIGTGTVRLRPPDGQKDWCEWDGDRDAFLTLVKTARQTATSTAFTGITHAELLEKQIDETPATLIDDLVETGTVGTIAGIPETHKSWLAQSIALAVAAGNGEVLGRAVTRQTAVGYFWQDDSERNEIERAQTLARVRETPPDLPLIWFLNKGLNLGRDDDFTRLRATIEKHGLGLVVLDSFYNVAAGLDLKDTGSGEIVARLKSEVCDPTGCTILIVDHAPWPTLGNKGQMRAYGDVHKGAAVRFGIYIAREGTKLYVEARGNNIRGFKRTVAYWDEEQLELRLVDSQPADEGIEKATAWLLAYVTENPGLARSKIEAAYKAEGGIRNHARAAIAAELAASTPRLAVGPGESPNGKYLYPASEANSPLAATRRSEYGESLFDVETEVNSPTRRPPVGGGDVAASRPSARRREHREVVFEVPEELLEAQAAAFADPDPDGDIPIPTSDPDADIPFDPPPSTKGGITDARDHHH
jgi:hypothetical protein